MAPRCSRTPDPDGARGVRRLLRLDRRVAFQRYGVFIGGTPEGVAVSDNTIDKFYGVHYSRAAAGIYSGNHVTDAFVPYYLVNNDGTRVLDGGGNLSDADSQLLIYGRVQPGAVETLEADYLSPLHRGSDFLFIPIRNRPPT